MDSPYVEVGVFRWLDHIKPGVTDVLGSTLDITPTVLHLAGLELPTDRIFDGEIIQIALTN
jgi:arylsulfatase A-like enzyme